MYRGGRYRNTKMVKSSKLGTHIVIHHHEDIDRKWKKKIIKINTIKPTSNPLDIILYYIIYYYYYHMTAAAAVPHNNDRRSYRDGTPPKSLLVI